MPFIRLCAILLLILAAALHPAAAGAEKTLVATATNFAEVMERLVPAFETETGHEIVVVTGSSGKLFAQIRNGAPFDVFLSADQERPRRLDEAGLTVDGSRFTYAIGRLVLWSADPERIGHDGAATLRAGGFRRLAMANPALAPYGAAARETLEALGLLAALEDRIVLGENVGQAHAMVRTGNAELGFVALSSLLSPRNEPGGSCWEVPRELYSPARQDAVLLRRAAGSPVAVAFLEWLRGDEARGVIERFGYDVE